MIGTMEGVSASKIVDEDQEEYIKMLKPKIGHILKMRNSQSQVCYSATTRVGYGRMYGAKVEFVQIPDLTPSMRDQPNLRRHSDWNVLEVDAMHAIQTSSFTDSDDS